MNSLTIVTCVLNGDPKLILSAESILPQVKAGRATWLIKNSSTTLNGCLHDYLTKEGVKIIGESDSSLYQGLNQALQHIDDGYFMVLGAGDTLTTGAVDLILATMESHSNLDGLYFAVQLSKSGRIFQPRPSDMLHRMACPHPGAVMSAAKVRSLGGFDERYQIAADYDLLCRYLAAYGASGWSDQVVVNFLGGGMSEIRALEGFLEEELIRLRVCKSTQLSVCERGLRVFENFATQLRRLTGV